MSDDKSQSGESYGPTSDTYKYRYKYATDDTQALADAKKKLEDKEKELKGLQKKFDELNFDYKAVIGVSILLLILQFFRASIVADLFSGVVWIIAPAWGTYRVYKFVRKALMDKISDSRLNFIIATSIATGLLLGFVFFSGLDSDRHKRKSKKPSLTSSYIYLMKSTSDWFEDLLGEGRGTELTCPKEKECEECKKCEPCKEVEISADPEPRTRCQPATTSCTLGISTNCPNCTITGLPPRPPLKPQPKSSCDPASDKANCPIPQITTDQPLTREVPKNIQYDLDKLPDHSRFIAPCKQSGDC